MTIKRRLDKMHTHIQVRLTVKEKSKIKALASVYAGGNLSAWMIYGAMNAPRKFIATKRQKRS